MKCGVADALAPFPLHQLVNTMAATINNNSVSVNVQEVLPALLGMCDLEELAEYDSTTPTTLDYLANYRDGVESMAYQIGLTGAQTAVGGLGATVAAEATRAALLFPAGAPSDVSNAEPFSGAASQKLISFPTNVLSHDLSRPIGWRSI